MKTDRLFNILVAGGMLITAPMAQAGDVEQEKDSQVILSELLEAEAIPGMLAFCKADDEDTCVENAEGEMVPRAGIQCCWSTSCEK